MSPRLLIKTRLGVTRPRLAYFGIPRPRTESCAGEHWDPRCRVADCVPVVGRKTGSRPRHFSVYQAGGVRDFQYCTIDSWSRTRRVVGKAEHTLEGANPRFVVTSLKCTRVAYDPRALYEDLYCARGEAENRVGEQFELFADRASSATMKANQLRMWFSAMAYNLVDTLRRVGPRHGQFADAAVAAIRLKLLKLGAQVCTSVRRIHSAIASGCPNKNEFELAYLYLQRAFSSV